MPFLSYVTSAGFSNVGFMFPVFKEYAGSNLELVQVVDEFDAVVEFHPYWGGEEVKIYAVDEINIAPGKQAIWAFRTPDGILRTGTRNELKTKAAEILLSGVLQEHPLAAAELTSFCDLEQQYPKILRSAYDSLEKLSRHSANTWLDTSILLPAIHRDIRENSKRIEEFERQIEDVYCFSRDGITHIYSPSGLHLGQLPLPRWRMRARIFGISDLQVHERGKRRPIRAKRPEWMIVGVGGVARFVLRRPPFVKWLRPSPPRAGVLAEGPAAFGDDSTNQLRIAIIGSDPEHRRTIEPYMFADNRDTVSRHVVNVRPIGFGTPSSSKLSVYSVRESAPYADRVWFISNHRLREDGYFATSLTASNKASRYVKLLSTLLVNSARESELAKSIIDGGRSGLGAIGVARYHSDVDPEELTKRAIYSMLSEDYVLTSSRSIITLWPYEAPFVRINTRLGRGSYEIDCIPSEIARRFQSVIAIALDFSFPNVPEIHFRDLVSAIMASYGWVERGDDGHIMLFENQGEAVALYVTTSPAEVFSALSEIKRTGYPDIVVTNRTVTRKMLEDSFFGDRNPKVIHYSGIGRWMRSVYDVGVFDDW